MQEKTAGGTPAAPLKLDVSVRVIEPVKNLMGFASVKFNDCFVVENLKKDIGGEWETKTELLPAMDAPVAAGEKVGELIYLLHGKEVGRTDLITAEAVEKANINTMLQRMLRQWF